MADMRMRVFTRDGRPIDELTGEVTRSWAINDVGTFKMRLARTDPKVLAGNLKFGNLVYIESSAMPSQPWGGFIWTPREWANDVIELEGLSGEGLLKQRVMKTQLLKAPRTSGALFTELITEANRRGDTMIRFNDKSVDDVRASIYEDTFYGHIVYDAIQELRKRSHFNFWLEPRLDSDNRMYFVAYWKKKRPYRGHQMVMNYNVIPSQKNVLSEDGDITTAVLVIGQGETLETAPSVYVESNNAIRQKWGLREMVITGNYETEGAALAAANSFLARESRVKRYYSLDAPFMDDPLLSTVRLGSTHELFVGDYGFTEEGVEARTIVSVKGIALAEKEGKVSLVVQFEKDDKDFIER